MKPPERPSDAATVARTRHFIVSLLRIFGGLLTILGIALFNGQIAPLGGGVDRWAGGALIVIGLLDFFLVPALLIRHWKRTA